MPREIDIADAVADTLNTAFSVDDLSFKRQHIAKIVLKGLEMQGSVVPVAVLQTRRTRGNWQNQYGTTVTLAGKVSRDFDASLDQLQQYAEQVMDTMKDAGRQAGAYLAAVERDPYVDYERLEEQNILQTVITFTYSIDN